MLECTFVSPLRQLVLESASGVYARATNGELGVLPGHAPMACALEPGSVVRVALPQGERRFRIGTDPFLRVVEDSVTLLAAEFTEESSQGSR